MQNPMELIRQRIDLLLARQQVVTVAIEGPCTAGKSTLAEQLAQEYDCNVFHMDDFFLQPHQRTLNRFTQPGGNVDYERFREEILRPLKTGLPFSYRPFDCGSFTLSQPLPVIPKGLNIIEGTYSLHPHFGDYADLKIFLTISPEVQRQRVLNRPAFLHDRFFREWIPMEEQYFTEFRIPEKCDLVL